MAAKRGGEKAQRIETISVERRRFIGQAIIDGLLTPREATLLTAVAGPDYDQGNGNYVQSTGGDHNQTSGDYAQSPALTSRNPAIHIIDDRIVHNRD
jgi:hypothetical protein